MKVRDRVFIVTGGGSGMGRQLTIQLVKKGARVIMADLNEAAMKETRELAGQDNVHAHRLNVAVRADVEAFARDVLEHSAVDGLINNAGIIQPFVDVKDLDYEKIERIMNVNFYGPLYLTKSFLPHMLTRPEAHLVNISSMGGFIPFPGQTIYGASKAAVKLLTEGLYAELMNTNVHVTVVHPGAVNTNITTNSGVAMPGSANASEATAKTLSSEKAASIIIDAIERNAFRVLVGGDASMLDKVYRLGPRMAVNLITKQMAKMKRQAGNGH
jgi:short-subunit dehydrogenase